MITFENHLKQWAEETVPICHEIAKNLNLSFYAFQTNPKESPELLVLGINPSGVNPDTQRAYEYSHQYNNPSWGLLDAQGMTPEVFLKRNMDQDYENWIIWKRLTSAFTNNQMKALLSNCMYMNLVYFSTPNFNDLKCRKDGINAIQQCRNFSLNLIKNIVKPKRILCLGTQSCFDLLPINSTKSLLEKRLLLNGELKESNIPVYGIPHPSGSRIFSRNKGIIGRTIEKEFGFA